METIELLLDEARGIYIPQAFYEEFDFGEWGLNIANFAPLSSPDNEDYWEAWEEVLRDAEHHQKGKTDDEPDHIWRLYQEGSLFAVRDDHQWDED